MKKNILFFIIGFIIATGITTAALTIASKDVSYDNTNSGSENTNVQGAIDELYENISNIGLDHLELVADLTSGNANRAATVTTSFTGQKDQYYYIYGYYLANGGGSTWSDTTINIRSIAGRLTFNNATIIEEYPDLDMVKIKVIADGTVGITMDTGNTNGNYKCRLLMKVYK